MSLDSRRRRVLLLSRDNSSESGEPATIPAFPAYELDELAGLDLDAEAEASPLESTFELRVESSAPVEVVEAVETATPVRTARPADEPVAQPDRWIATREERHAFRNACGATSLPRLEVTRPNGSSAGALVWKRPYVIIGTASDCDVQIAQPTVDYHHAYLQLVRGRVYCVDLDSRTGTHWEDGPRQSGWLENGQSIAVGPYRLTLHVDGAATQHPAEEPALPKVELELACGEQAPTTIALPHEVTLIGRSVHCNVQLLFDGVEDIQCSLLRTHGGVWAIDLSGSGCVIGGRVAPYGRLTEESALSIGGHTLRVRQQQPTARIEAQTEEAEPQTAPHAEPSPADLNRAVHDYVLHQQAAFGALRAALEHSLQQSGKTTGPLADAIRQLEGLGAATALVAEKLAGAVTEPSPTSDAIVESLPEPIAPAAAATPKVTEPTQSQTPDPRPRAQKPPRVRRPPTPEDVALRERLSELDRKLHQNQSGGWFGKLLGR